MEKLYTGEEIESYELYAQVFTSILVTYTYASGMPALYPIAFINFFILYWVYKILLVKSYKKTIAFNQDLPFFTIRYFKYAIFFHMFFSSIMFTNQGILGGSSRLNKFSDNVSSFTTSYTDQAESYSESYIDISDRLSNPFWIIYVVLLSLLFSFFFFKGTFYQLILYTYKRIY